MRFSTKDSNGNVGKTIHDDDLQMTWTVSTGVHDARAAGMSGQSSGNGSAQSH